MKASSIGRAFFFIYERLNYIQLKSPLLTFSFVGFWQTQLCNCLHPSITGSSIAPKVFYILVDIPSPMPCPRQPLWSVPLSLFPSFAFSEKSYKWTRTACNLSNWLLPLSTMHTTPTFEIHSYCCGSEPLVLLFYCRALFIHSEGNLLSQFPWAGVVFLGHGTSETKTRVIGCLIRSLVEGHWRCF